MLPIVTQAQKQHLSGFENLVNKVWVAEGSWSNNTPFKQEIHFTFQLNNTIVIANTKGYTNKAQTNFGNKNHGVRQYNTKTKTIDFWEFDIFGNLTKGTVEIKGKDIWYYYNYGDTTMADHWKYKNNNTYLFTVGSFKNKKWETIYLKTQFKVKDE